MRKYPIHKERMKQRMDRITEMRHFKIPAIFALECKLALIAYYGSGLRAAFSMIWDWVYLQTHDRYWRIVLWFTDKVGWTKLRPIPGTLYVERHGGKCEYHNCQDMDCIEKSLPPWFRKISGWDWENK